MSDFSREPLAPESEVLPPPTGASESSSTYRSSHLSTGSPSSGSAAGSTVDTAKDEAKQVSDTAAESGKQVAETAKGEAKNVAAETKQQAVSLLDTVRAEVGEQANTSQNRIADTLHGLSKELGGLASGSSESGPLTDLAHEASRKGGEVAHWLQEREPSDVLDEVRAYARRRPGTFLLLCGLAGVVAGRLTRSAVASRTSLDSDDSNSANTRPALGGDRAAIGRRSDNAAEAGVSYAGQGDPAAADAEDAGVAAPPAAGYFGAASTWDDQSGGPNR